MISFTRQVLLPVGFTLFAGFSMAGTAIKNTKGTGAKSRAPASSRYYQCQFRSQLDANRDTGSGTFMWHAVDSLNSTGDGSRQEAVGRCTAFTRLGEFTAAICTTTSDAQGKAVVCGKDTLGQLLSMEF